MTAQAIPSRPGRAAEVISRSADAAGAGELDDTLDYEYQFGGGSELDSTRDYNEGMNESHDVVGQAPEASVPGAPAHHPEEHVQALMDLRRLGLQVRT